MNFGQSDCTLLVKFDSGTLFSLLKSFRGGSTWTGRDGIMQCILYHHLNMDDRDVFLLTVLI